MNIYEYAPQKNFKKLSGIVMLLICAATVLFLIPSVFSEMPFRWVLQSVGLLCLVAVVYISVRYVGRAHIYAIIQNDEGGHDLTVTEISNGGKSRITVCRISVANVEEVIVLDRRNNTDKLKIKQLNQGRKKFSYHPDFNAGRACYVSVVECGEPLVLKLAEDKRLIEYLKGIN